MYVEAFRALMEEIEILKSENAELKVLVLRLIDKTRDQQESTTVPEKRISELQVSRR
jgi:hypothetical protein